MLLAIVVSRMRLYSMSKPKTFETLFTQLADTTLDTGLPKVWSVNGNSTHVAEDRIGTTEESLVSARVTDPSLHPW
jgi:hypothetical protein